MNKRPPRNGEIVQKTQNTLLVDGNALFKSSISAAKNVYNKHGQHIGGIYAFMTTLRMLLTKDLYHRVYVFWDGNFSGKLRYEIYHPYKSGRGKDYINGNQPKEESEVKQLKRVWDYLNEMYIRQLKNEVIEGDDFIAYYCLNKQENEKITIASNDRDMCQLISRDVKLYLLDKKVYVDYINYSSYFCHHQENSVLLKMITGCDADTIKGIKLLGEKTALDLFPELKERKITLDEIIQSATQQQKERLEAKKGPLKVLHNIINRVTDGVQGDRIYEINERLVNLKAPLMTEEGIRDLEQLIEGTLDSSGRDLKNVLVFMEKDGLKRAIGDMRYPDYLVPFKELIHREQY